MTALTQPQTQPQVQTYATPSWSLAIASQSSPLAKWWGKPLAQTLTFTLVSQGGTHPLKIKGDQSQLQLLAEVTEDYVEQVLSAPSSWLGESERSPESFNQTALASRLPQGVFKTPTFQSNSLLSHQLRLTGLDHDHPQSAVQLSITEIFDLAETLNQATQNINVLPSVSAVRLFPQISRTWTKTAAVAAFALITTGTLALLFGRGGQFQTANQPESEANPSGDKAGVARPNQPGGPNQPTALNPQTSNESPPIKGTSNAGKSSSIAQADSNTQNLANSNSQKVPSAEASGSSSSSSSSSSNSDATARRSSSPTTDPQKLNQQRQRLGNPTEKESSTIASRLSPSPGPNQSETRASRAQSDPALSAKPSASAEPSSPLTPAEKARNLARRQEILDKLAKLESPRPQTKGLDANTAPGATIAPPNSPVSAPIPEPRQSAPGDFNQTASERFNAGAAGVAPANVSPNVSPAAQVTSYFKARWQGQASIQETLSYDLVLNRNGTVQSIAPKNTLTQQSRAKVALPTAGQTLTSPFSAPNPQRLTVNLKPDGTVTVTPGGL